MSWVARGGGLTLSIPEGKPVDDLQEAAIVAVGEGADALPVPVLPRGGRVLPALTQSQPADVISGWVRLWVAGVLSARTQWDGVICALHGDVSHWLQVSAEEIVSCQSFLTPRLISLLGGEPEGDETALSDSLSRPERLAAHLRSAELSGQAAAITGHLIGAELAAARPYWLGQEVVVIGDGVLARCYASAIAVQGVPVAQSDIAAVLPAGLAALQNALDLGTE